ncbi:serine/threonine-protein kinase [Streptomyces sp. WMMC500]|uniref:serine/threonine-protein kinase n=1 Tax=Streptomyces sp. WMMC500 TaxID=3015154 RepID=UPI00248B6230|nr:serine/threonine-protein kinase [Streptomyces sp. WMMC500]WBB57697.1 serine/threonine-protein kinase [Streptomyces sp. WMMC500]
MAGASGLLIAGRYRLGKPVGQGGMGRVWSARDELLERQVAVKEILFDADVEDRQREKQLRRMIVEARAAARLNHPGITTVHDVVVHDGAPVIVMEFVAGRSLAAVLREQTRLPVPRVAALGVQVLDALAEAHAAGVVHRDLKPDNILITDRRPVITDFGIAAIADAAAGPEGSAGLTTTGGMLGTPAYASPEQLSGERATAATDIWSFGATLYAAVEGRLPFHGANLWTLREAICESAPAPFHHAGALAPILTALLAKIPADRPTLAAAAAELSRHTGRTPPDTPGAPAPPARRPRRLGWKLLPGRRTPSAPAYAPPSLPAPHAPPPLPTRVMRTDPVEELERGARERLHSQVQMHLGLLDVIAAAPPSDADLLTGLKNLKDTHTHRVGRILEDEAQKLLLLRDGLDEESWRAVEPYAAHHGEWLDGHRRALAALDETLGLSTALLTGDSPRQALLAAVDAFRSHMLELRSD